MCGSAVPYDNGCVCGGACARIMKERTKEGKGGEGILAIMRYGGDLPPNVREIVCGHMRDYGRRERLISGAFRRGDKMILLQRYNRGIDNALSQAFSAHGILGEAANVVRRDVLQVASGRKALCVNGYGAMLSRGLYIAVREDVLFFVAREFGLV